MFIRRHNASLVGLPSRFAILHTSYHQGLHGRKIHAGRRSRKMRVEPQSCSLRKSWRCARSSFNKAGVHEVTPRRQQYAAGMSGCDDADESARVRCSSVRHQITLQLHP